MNERHLKTQSPYIHTVTNLSFQGSIQPRV